MSRPLAALLVLIVTLPAFAQSTCDIAVTPAATLLLPYFEVQTGGGATTLFSITNTSPSPQIAKVTVWTDWAFPVLTFNLVLTGYDVQPVNLYDVIVDGKVPATSIGDGSNPNFLHDARATCAGLPGTVPAELMTAVRNALTLGTGYSTSEVNCTGPVGGIHPGVAVGYVTIDVASHCSTRMPTDADGAYFAGPTAPLLYDNVLLGDYQQISPTPAGSVSSRFDAAGAPMVHIRAVPEGGLSGAGGGMTVATNLPFTFYDRYTPDGARAADRRQPLPSEWMARFVAGGGGTLATDLKIWREGLTRSLPTCSNAGTVQNDSVIGVTSIVRFDEHDNSWTGVGHGICCVAPRDASFPAASRVSTFSLVFPDFPSFDNGGWLYLNLGSGAKHLNSSAIGYACFGSLSAQREGFGGPCATAPPGSSGSRATTQNWVIVSMYGVVGGSRLAVDFDAAWLANGCTPMAQKSAPIRASLRCPAGTWNCGPGTLPPAVNP